MYNAKDGKTIWSALLGDHKLDFARHAWIQDTAYDLAEKGDCENFMETFRSLVWMTYRTNFAPLLETISASVREDLGDSALPKATQRLYNSDNGWGCTIRVGQMALSNCLIRHKYSMGFSLRQLEARKIHSGPHAKILSQFWDSGRGKEHPFSIQNFAETVLLYDKLPGEWLSQSTVATILKDLNAKYQPYPDLEVLTFVDGCVYEDQLFAACTLPTGDKKELEKSEIAKEYVMVENPVDCDFPEEKKDAGRAAIVFVSSSLGLKRPEEAYLAQIKLLFSLPQLVGLMGGRANEALFFVGYQDRGLIFFDPHLVQVPDGVLTRGSKRFPRPI